MVATVTVNGRGFALPIYRLVLLREAAPFIDRQKARQEAIEARAGVSVMPGDSAEVRADKLAKIVAASTMQETMDNMADACSVLLAGIARQAPEITLDDVMDAFDPTPEGMAGLLTAMQGVLQRSGMQSVGEASAPSPAAAPGA